MMCVSYGMNFLLAVECTKVICYLDGYACVLFLNMHFPPPSPPPPLWLFLVNDQQKIKYLLYSFMEEEHGPRGREIPMRVTGLRVRGRDMAPSLQRKEHAMRDIGIIIFEVNKQTNKQWAYKNKKNHRNVFMNLFFYNRGSGYRDFCKRPRIR